MQTTAAVKESVHPTKVEKRWGKFVDTSDISQVVDRNRLTITPQPSPESKPYMSMENDVLLAILPLVIQRSLMLRYAVSQLLRIVTLHVSKLQKNPVQKHAEVMKALSPLPSYVTI